MTRNAPSGPAVADAAPASHRLGLIRSLRAVAGLTLAVSTLSGCGMLDWGSQFAPTPVPHSPRPSVGASSAAPTPALSPSAASVAATGEMLFYANPVTDKLVGSCTMGSTVTIVLTDQNNDFYGTVDVTVVLDPTAVAVNSVQTSLGEDAEEGTHEMSFTADAPATGTSAALSGTGPDYKITGTLQDTETRHGKQTLSLIPFTINAKCQAKA